MPASGHFTIPPVANAPRLSPRQIRSIGHLLCSGTSVGIQKTPTWSSPLRVSAGDEAHGVSLHFAEQTVKIRPRNFDRFGSDCQSHILVRGRVSNPSDGGAEDQS